MLMTNTYLSTHVSTLVFTGGVSGYLPEAASQLILNYQHAKGSEGAQDLKKTRRDLFKVVLKKNRSRWA